MTPSKNKLKTCPNGHQFYKSSDCPVCPICEDAKKPVTGFFSQISAPARHALENNGISTQKNFQLSANLKLLNFMAWAQMQSVNLFLF